MPSLYLRLAAYLGAALACIGLGWHLGGLSPKAALAALQAQDWQAKQQATQAALTAVQLQLKKAQDTAANNSTVIQGLETDNAKISANWASDRALVQRLLNDAKATPAAGSSDVPKAGGGQAASGASDAASNESVENMVVAAAQECERTADQLNALIAEITPQL